MRCRSSRVAKESFVQGAYGSQKFNDKLKNDMENPQSEEGEKKALNLRQWKKRNTPVKSEFFERRHYEDFIDSYQQDGNLGLFPRWDHFPHPTRVFEDLQTHGNYGAGIRFRDAKTSYFLFVIADRIRKLTTDGRIDQIPFELQQAEYLRDLCKLKKCGFGPRSRFGLLRCYEYSNNLLEADGLFQEIVRLDDEMLWKKAASYFSLLIKNNKIDKAVQLYQELINKDDPLQSTAGDSLLENICENTTTSPEYCKEIFEIVGGTASPKCLFTYVTKTGSALEVRTQFSFMAPQDVDTFWSLVFKDASPEVIFKLWESSALDNTHMTFNQWTRWAIACSDHSESRELLTQFCEVLPPEETAAIVVRVLRWCNKKETLKHAITGIHMYSLIIRNGRETTPEAASLAEQMAKRITKSTLK